MPQSMQPRAARAVLAVASVTKRGAFDIEPQEAEIARVMFAQTAEVTVTADSSKMGRVGVFEVCPMAAGRIVIDSMDKPLRDAAKSAGVRVENSSPD